MFVDNIIGEIIRKIIGKIIWSNCLSGFSSRRNSLSGGQRLVGRKITARETRRSAAT